MKKECLFLVGIFIAAYGIVSGNSRAFADDEVAAALRFTPDAEVLRPFEEAIKRRSYRGNVPIALRAQGAIRIAISDRPDQDAPAGSRLLDAMSRYVAILQQNGIDAQIVPSESGQFNFRLGAMDPDILLAEDHYKRRLLDRRPQDFARLIPLSSDIVIFQRASNWPCSRTIIYRTDVQQQDGKVDWKLAYQHKEKSPFLRISELFGVGRPSLSKYMDATENIATSEDSFWQDLVAYCATSTLIIGFDDYDAYFGAKMYFFDESPTSDIVSVRGPDLRPTLPRPGVQMGQGVTGLKRQRIPALELSAIRASLYLSTPPNAEDDMRVHLDGMRTILAHMRVKYGSPAP